MTRTRWRLMQTAFDVGQAVRAGMEVVPMARYFMKL
jgi:hypothetical protein